MGFDTSYDRGSGWGASETGRIYHGCRKTYLRKRDEREKPEEPYVKPFEGNESTENGNTLEPFIIETGAKKAGVEISTVEPETKTHPDLDFIFATTDALGVGPNGVPCVVEAKLVGIGPHLDWGSEDDGWDGVPFLVQAQVATQMAVHERDEAWVFAFIGSTVKTYHLERDREFELELFKICGDVWELVVAREDPPPGPEDVVRQFYSKKWKASNGNTLVTEDACELIRHRQVFNAHEKEAKENRLTIENALRILIAEHDAVECSIGRATNKFSKNGRRTLRVKMFEEKNDE